MIVEYVRYQLTRHEPEALIEAYGIAGESLRAAPECLGFDLAQCEEEPNSMVMRILWTSRQAHLKGFRGGPNFPPFLAAVRPFIDEITEMRHYEPTELNWVR